MTLRLGSRSRTTLFSSFLILLLFMPQMYAQLTTGSLSGTITDTAKAVVPNANVVLLDEATKDRRTTTSNSVGHFTFAAVQPRYVHRHNRGAWVQDMAAGRNPDESGRHPPGLRYITCRWGCN